MIDNKHFTATILLKRVAAVNVLGNLLGAMRDDSTPLSSSEKDGENSTKQ